MRTIPYEFYSKRQTSSNEVLPFYLIAITALFPIGLTNTYISPIIILSLTLSILISRSLINTSVLIRILIFYIIITNIFAYIISDQYNIWQFIRSGIPYLISIISIPCGKAFAQNHAASEELDFLFKIMLIGAILSIFLFLIDSEYYNSIIAASGRIFAYPGLCFLALSFFYAKGGNIILLILAMIVNCATLSKGILFSQFLIIILLVFADQRKIILKSLNQKSYKVSILVLISATLYLSNGILTERFEQFINEGDNVREIAMQEALTKLYNDPLIAIFGASFGVPMLDGYWSHGVSNGENDKLFDNSTYQMDNGFINIILSSGIVGIILIAISLWDMQQNWQLRLLMLFIILPLLLTSGSILFTADGALSIFVLSYVMERTAFVERNKR